MRNITCPAFMQVRLWGYTTCGTCISMLLAYEGDGVVDDCCPYWDGLCEGILHHGKEQSPSSYTLVYTYGTDCMMRATVSSIFINDIF